MKRFDLFCASQASTEICSSMDHHNHGNGGGIGNSRAIDRHNPHLRDTRRSRGLINNNTTPTSSSSYNQLPKNNKPKPYKHNHHQKTTKKISATKQITDLIFNHRKTSVSSKPIIDLFSPRKISVSKPITDLFTPPGSSRYLLSDTSFLDVLSDFDPISDFHPLSALVPITSSSSSSSIMESTPRSNLDHKSPSNLQTCSSTRSPNQVVVLRVSLHCKGCEGKVRKHISTMKGVTSYSIDFASKKVTVIGDVTPSSVLASVSKVKSAQFWSSSSASSKLVESTH